MAVVLATSLALAGVATAHTGLEQAVPAEGAQLTAAPAEVLLRFTGPVLGIERLQVRGPGGGDLVVERRRAVDGTTVGARLRRGGRGAYAVRWAVQGADGHTIEGEYSFAVSAPVNARAISRAASALIAAAVRLRADGPR